MKHISQLVQVLFFVLMVLAVSLAPLGAAGGDESDGPSVNEVAPAGETLSSVVTVLSGENIALGHSISDNITVTGPDADSPIPTGQAEVYLNDSLIATVDLVNGSAQATVTPTAAGAYHLDVRYLGDETYAEAWSAPEPFTVIGEADISVTKVFSPDPVHAGEVLVYTITVHNAGPSVADNVTLTDQVPAVLLNPQYSTDNGSTWFDWIGSLNLGDVGVDTANDEVVLIRATVDSDLCVTTCDDDDDCHYKCCCQCEDNGCSENECHAYSTSNDDENYECNCRDEKERHEHRCHTCVTDCGTVENQACAYSSSTPDPDTSNNCASATTEVVPPSADLSVEKVGTPDIVSVGDNITYTITVHNAGPSIAEDVVLFDHLPAYLQNPQYSADNGDTWLDWTKHLKLGDIEVGDAYDEVVLIRATVGPKDAWIKNNCSQDSVFRSQCDDDEDLWSNAPAVRCGSIENRVFVSSRTHDPDPKNNRASVVTTLRTADLSVTITDLGSVSVGDNVTYTITVHNAGPFVAENVTFGCCLSARLLNPQYSTDNGTTWLDWTGSLNLGDIDVGTENNVVVLIRATVGEDASWKHDDDRDQPAKWDWNPSCDGPPVKGDLIWAVAYAYSSETPDPDIKNNLDWDLTVVDIAKP
jgi:uncharacterized repeat protein (TIGR01451 family)